MPFTRIDEYQLRVHELVPQVYLLVRYQIRYIKRAKPVHNQVLFVPLLAILLAMSYPVYAADAVAGRKLAEQWGA